MKKSFGHCIKTLVRKALFVELTYFILLSLLCFLPLKFLNLRRTSPKNIDLYFTSVSTVTDSSMATLEMETFSNSQLLFMTFFMFVGGEIFSSLPQLYFRLAKLKKGRRIRESQNEFQLKEIVPDEKTEEQTTIVGGGSSKIIEMKSIECLAFLVTFYVIFFNLLGFLAVLTYLKVVKSAEDVLRIKGLNAKTFSVFTAVSTFTNCGFIPTNESMAVFREDSGLLLILIVQTLMGNTLYPVFLRILIWVLEKITGKTELVYLLRNSGGNIGYTHLMSRERCFYLLITAVGFIGVQFAVYCWLEWKSVGGSFYRKIVGSLFQVVNSRHTGESVVDLSTLNTAVLVLIILMMYLPPYTSYLPTSKQEEEEDGKMKKNLVFSQPIYLTIFIILVCITEKRSIKNDPLNFNLLSIALEVISAYGNVGFSMGYSCGRRINLRDGCIDGYFGFVGKWSYAGKLLLILVMFYGKMKKYNRNGGRAWKLFYGTTQP